MPLTLAQVTQADVEREVSNEYRAARTPPGTPQPAARVVHITNWNPPDANSDFMRSFGDARRGQRTDEVIEVKTEKIGTGKVAVFLVPNTKNATLKNLHGKLKVKVGEAQL
jgi:hypothetical protein